MDTAPTGHTLLLLDSTGKHHKEILKTTSISPDRITTPYMALQDSKFAKKASKQRKCNHKKHK